LSIEQEAVIVAFRKHTLLPLDDCLYALQATIPPLTRSSLHRCLERHGISRLQEVEGDRPRKKKFDIYPIAISRDFVDFLKEVVSRCPPEQQIHIILDNLPAHKTALAQEFLEQNPRVRFHFPPTYSSWLNQIELWFAKIEREVIARGVFTSVPDLARKLRRYINASSANAQPIQ
jgi:transposase